MNHTRNAQRNPSALRKMDPERKTVSLCVPDRKIGQTDKREICIPEFLAQAIRLNV